MFNWFRQWRAERVVRANPIDERDWQQVLEQLPLLKGLTADELTRLRRLAILFMHEKDFVGIQGVVLTGNMALLIALQACLPILNLGIEWYRGWQSILVYPAGFKTQRTQMDASGVAHEAEHHLAGEAWNQGGVVLAWNETAKAGVIDGHNLVIHEFVHKLDMLNGAADGFPPLRAGMSVDDWTASFGRAYDDLCEKVARGEHTNIDRYGATNPAEFVAVTSEVFFELPALLRDTYPLVYRNYVAFYGQDPAQRL
ncbi:M90 family metallopeptidase [uncultured Gilvimarinus sp.]|mgnify:CR=1 FL=1|uniref:M90 family metallopeptidase n=1 Tax=uncultured Gilvimarinus sp. TaxID=1689143 RepID=UPI0030EB4911|tara:strand:- start:12585 stop:13349 length:765 start_codon:yes stop_codon:yes gene_type:complete